MWNFLTSLVHDIDWSGQVLAGGRVLVVLALAWSALLVIRVALHRFELRLIARMQGVAGVATEASKRAATLTKLLRRGLVMAVWAMALLIVLAEMGVNIGPVLASAGIVGLAVGFGAQNLVRDVIAGFFLVLEDQVRVGDVAAVNGVVALVEQINFRTIVLRDLSGTVHIFPNGTISTLANLTKEWSGYVMDISVAYKEDTDHVVAVMKDAAAQLRRDAAFGPLMMDDLEVFGVDQFAESAVVIKARLRTVPGKQWDVGREYRRRLKQAFDAAGIEIPFPQRVVSHPASSVPR